MKRVLGFSALLILLSAGVVLGAGEAVNVYGIPRWVVAGGGGYSAASQYALTGTVGQAVVDTTNKEAYVLCSGFWCGEGKLVAYLPLVSRQSP